MARSSDAPRTLAFFLPQFHAIPENDSWWGDGFTEWTNVRAAKPQFAGHDHPRVPTDSGYYDLSSPERVFPQQVQSAADSDIDGFCFYTYWFDGERLLESPVDWYRDNGPTFPFCVSWANESWTRRWDGKDHEVLMPQTYPPGFAAQLFRDFLPYFSHPSYIQVAGKPVFLVHRVDQIPDPRRVAETWRRLSVEAGLPGIHLVAAETKWGLDPADFGFDAVVEFPPVGSNTLASAWRSPLRDVSPQFSGRLLSYERLASRFIERAEPDFCRYPSVAPNWDNTARRGKNATIYIGSNPEAYRAWLEAARKKEQRVRGSSGFVFVNAWNEWAEGAYLEPDVTWGNRYAQATRWDATPMPKNSPHIERGRWNVAQVRSLVRLAVGSVLATARRTRMAVLRRLHGVSGSRG